MNDPVADEQLRMIISGWDSDSLWRRMAEELIELREGWRKRGEALEKARKQMREVAVLVKDLEDQRPVAWLVVAMGDIDNAFTPQQQPPGT